MQASLFPSGILKEVGLFVGGLALLFIIFKIFEHYMSESDNKSVIHLESGGYKFLK